MQRIYLSLVLTVTISFVANWGWCASSSTKAFKLSVTLPQTISLISDQKAREDSRFTEYAAQIVQEERVKRDNRLVLVTSIVAR